MEEEHRHALESADKAQERATEVLEDLIAVAGADKVFSEPVVAGDRTIITAAEIRTGMGFGYGLVSGIAARVRRMRRSEGNGVTSSAGGPRSGGGGGGQAVGRPVAVITVEPDGVTVEPVLDRTKIAMTALTAAGALGSMLIWKRRAGSR